MCASISASVVNVKVMWPYGQENLDDFILHCNSTHTNIKFTMAAEGLK
jgi:hypothetical protein